MGPQLKANTWIYAGLFLVTLATLMHEILLTRIFSVTMWYHYAFVAISVALFGMTAGAILVYVFPKYFTRERTKHHLALSSLLFSGSIIVSSLTHLSIPFLIGGSMVVLYSIVFTYIVISVPFVFSGVCVCLALTRFSGQVSKLYAADLAGAAVGCILLILTLKVTDGLTAIFVVAFLACAGTLCFAAGQGFGKLRRTASVFALSLAAFAVANTVLANQQIPWLRLVWVKGQPQQRPLYEKWNSFSRIRVDGIPSMPEPPYRWGLSATYPPERRVRQLYLDIDAGASTVLTAFDGDLKNVEHLKYDVVNLAYHLKPDAKVLVIGSGGGRDILSGLVFGANSLLGVDINENIIDAVNRQFGDFTGHLDRNPKVNFVNDEARSYIARSKDKFDLIQISLIDTAAATVAGAYVLTENSLYTTEAWKVLLEHLNAHGILTVSRWYFGNRPGEMYRLTSLARAALLQLGIDVPRQHIIIAREVKRGDGWEEPLGVGTMLVSKEPFSERDLTIIERIAQEMRFDLILTPRFARDSVFATLASKENIEAFVAASPINIAAPTDDSPFFFHLLRLRDSFNPGLWLMGEFEFNMKAVLVLGMLLAVVVVLTVLCILIPLMLNTDRTLLRQAVSLSTFFVCIGLGFMFVEISQMQRLIVFLGHPVYGLSVVLFALLLSSGLGSFLTRQVSDPRIGREATIRLFLLLGVIALFGILTPQAIRLFQGATTTMRILVATGVLFPLGLFMGMAFPLGMKVASTRFASLTAWFWGINGATSVCASVIAVAIAMNWGISTAFWIGFVSYVSAVVVFVQAR